MPQPFVPRSRPAPYILRDAFAEPEGFGKLGGMSIGVLPCLNFAQEDVSDKQIHSSVAGV